MFADFYDYDELENMARMVYRQKFGGWRDSSDPFLNEDDAIQAMIIHVWRRHTAYDPSASSKKTWINMLLKFYVLSILKHALKPCRFTENKCSIEGIDVADDYRVPRRSVRRKEWETKKS